MNIYKKSILKIMFFSFVFLFGVGLINFMIDPLKQYAFNMLNLKPCFNNGRFLGAGLVKSYKYDTLLIGSSMTENFLVDEINKKLDTKTLKVPFSGGSAHEYNQLLTLALKIKKAKVILFGLDVFAFFGEPNRLRYGEGSFPFYLYNDNILNHYKYLHNFDVFYKENIKILAVNFLNIHKTKGDIKRAYYWGDKYLFSKKEMLKSYSPKIFKKKPKERAFLKLKKSFDMNLLFLIKNNPNVKFIFFYPPYSILQYKNIKDELWLDDFLKFKKYVFESIGVLKNVNIYDFQTVKSVTHNLDNYKDISHYSPKINSWMIDRIKNKDFLLTKDNFYKYLDNLKIQTEVYRLEKF